MKTLGLHITNKEGRGQYRIEGEGARRHGVINLTMSDNETTSVNRDVHVGGLIDGSNSPFKNRPALGNDLCKGMELEEAVQRNYAVNGHRVIDGEVYVTGRDHAFRWSPEDPEVVQTYNFTLKPGDPKTAHRQGWRNAFRVSGRVPSMMVHGKAKADRSDEGKSHQTTGVELNRNSCTTQLRNEGKLKA